MKKDDQSFQDLILCVDEFDADPFDENASELSYVQSVVIASRELLEDVQNVLEKWEKQSNDIL